MLAEILSPYVAIIGLAVLSNYRYRLELENYSSLIGLSAVTKVTKVSYSLIKEQYMHVPIKVKDD